MKLFLTGDDGGSGGARVGKLERGSEIERSKDEVRRGGVFIVEVKNRSPEEIGRTCP